MQFGSGFRHRTANTLKAFNHIHDMAIFLKKITSSSNKTQTLPKQADQDHHTKQPDGLPKPDGYHPFIDKLSIVVTPLSVDEGDIYNAIWTVLDDAEVFSDAGAKAKWGPFKVAKWINLTSTPERVRFHFGYVGKNAVKLRLEFNPRKIGSHGLTELKSILTMIFPDGWEYVIAHGNITRIDVAVDFPNTRPCMFAVLPQQALTTKSWDVKGKLETFVLGKKKGNQTLLYNKKLQRLAQGKPWVGKSVTRLERRLRNPHINGLSGLHLLPNPFKGLLLTEVTTDPPSGEKKSWVWELFKDSVLQRGLPSALALLPKERRTLYRGHLNKNAHPLWDPIAIWENWPTVIKQSELDH
jgi:hypothetical protein